MSGKISSKKEQVTTERGERIRILRKMLDMSLAEFSDLCQIGESTLRLWESGKGYGMPDKNAHKIINAIQTTNVVCTTDWLLAGIGLPPTFKHTTSLTATFSEQEAIEKEINMFYQNVEQAITLDVNDNSMEPFYHKGDMVGGKQYHHNEIERWVGEIVIAKTQDNLFLLRKLHQGDVVNKFNLIAISPERAVNHAVLLNVDLVFVAPIMRLWRVFGE